MNCLNSLLWNICSSNSQQRDKPELCEIPPLLQQISNGLGNIKFLRTYNQVRENKHPTVSFSPLKRNEEHPGEWLKQQASRKKKKKQGWLERFASYGLVWGNKPSFSIWTFSFNSLQQNILIRAWTVPPSVFQTKQNQMQPAILLSAALSGLAANLNSKCNYSHQMRSFLTQYIL